MQLLGARSIITLPMAVLDTTPIPDPQSTLTMIDRVLAWQDTLAGIDAPSPNRMHFLVDITATQTERDQFYMYAGHGFIGMLDDNTQDLTDPALLAQNWAMWHEIGHQQQQTSWTWTTFTEINVNIFSLYVQGQLGLPSRLVTDGVYDQARTYLAGHVPDYISDDPDAYFIKRVMLDQLRAAYGWDVFFALNRTTRDHPLPWDASDQDKADSFANAVCGVTGHDLRPFFTIWALDVTAPDCATFPAPQVNPATLF